MGGFDDVARVHGLLRESNNPYRCGGGDSLNHFDEVNGNCSAYPWGGNCISNPDPKWFWGGAGKVVGEEAMKSRLTWGVSLYLSFDVYANFFLYSSGVYSETAGDEKGGHAVSAIGYGSEGGVHYWLVQNSWGTNWGVEGFAKFKRGVNLAKIETGAMAVRAWVEGAEVPACEDSMAGSGLLNGMDQSPMSCEDAAYLCDDASWGTRVRTNCMKTCNDPLCSGTNGVAATTTPLPGTESKYDVCLAEMKSIMAR